MQSPQPMQNILYHEYLSIERSRSKKIFFLQRLSYNVFLTTSFSQRISHSVFLKPLSLHNHPHNVVPTRSQYTRNLSVLYKYIKISQIRLSSNPRNFAICRRSNWNLDVAHLQYIFFHFAGLYLQIWKNAGNPAPYSENCGIFTFMCGIFSLTQKTIFW